MPRTTAYDKNAINLKKYMEILDKTTKFTINEIPKAYGYRLGKVIKTPGGGRLKVLIQDGSEELVLISQSVKIMGRAGNKTDRPNCMCINDLILIDGGYAMAKIPPSTVIKILDIFEKHECILPDCYSSVSTATKEDDFFDYEDKDKDKDKDEATKPEVKEDEKENKLDIDRI
jgi:hypothetical protein